MCVQLTLGGCLAKLRQHECDCAVASAMRRNNIYVYVRCLLVFFHLFFFNQSMFLFLCHHVYFIKIHQDLVIISGRAMPNISVKVGT